MAPTLHPADRLMTRVVRAVECEAREVVVVAGSGLTMPAAGQPGVPTAAGMIDRIRAYLAEHEPGELPRFDDELARARGSERYALAFAFVQGMLGQDDANHIVRHAVLEARHAANDAAHAGDAAACRALLDDTAGWALSPGVAALGRLAGRRRVANTILTTNFDPLIEVAIRAAGGSRYRTVLHGDGSLAQAAGDGAHVVYLHGYWFGSDTLHTQAQLGQPRPRLADSLRALLRERVVLVLGYGGWDDAFMAALGDVMDDDHAKPDVLWALYERDADEVERRYPRLMDPRLHGRGRLTLFRGVDAHAFLPDLADRLAGAAAPVSSPTAAPAPAPALTSPASPAAAPALPVGQGMAAAAWVDDRLPMTGEHLFGREAELARLDAAWGSDKTRVVTVVAQGGQGKTALINHWLGRMAADDWRGAARVLAWTFYSQGTAGDASKGSGSADLFFEHALAAFGRAEPVRSPSERGAVLARLVAEQPTLLIIDGLEPLQAGPNSTLAAGQLLDPGLRTFLRGLAVHNPRGLCVVTTREPVADLGPFVGQTVDRLDLERLSAGAGQALLAALGCRGPAGDLAAAVDELAGHALAVTLLGTYVRTALSGDIGRRGEAVLLDAGRGSDHARRVMATYERWFGPGPALSALYMLGLFDRPASAAEIQALRRPAIPGLTDALAGLPEPAWQMALSALREARLLAEPDGAGGLDAHPLVREYFGERLHEARPEAWQAGHERLYRHLAAAAPERPDTVHAMRPLFWAVGHGCAAGLHQEVLDRVLRARIDRGGEHFAENKLGAFGARLGALGHLFDAPFSRPAAALSPPAQAWLPGTAGFCLRALGRASDAAAPLAAGLEAVIEAEHWPNAASSANNLAELHQGLGDLAQAERLASQAVEHADQSGEAFHRMFTRTTLADARAQRGQAAEAACLFAQAEAIQAEWQPAYPMLYSLPGYRTCALRLDRGQALAAGWRTQLSRDERASWSRMRHKGSKPATPRSLARMYFAQVRERAAQTLAWTKQHGSLLTIALDHLTLGRAWLLEAAYVSPAKPEPWKRARAELDQAVSGLRDSGQEDDLPLGLLARAAWHRWRLAHPSAPAAPAGLAAAERDLAEVEYLAARGPWRLHQADLALERCHLALALSDPAAARAYHAQAAKIIAEIGYHRRDAELADLSTRLNEEPNP